MYQPQVVKRAVYWYKTDWRKQQFVKRTGHKFGLQTFVETGTYRGDMTAAARKAFKQVYSIEIHPPFYERAVQRFASDPGVKIILGDSGEKMKEVVSAINEPSLFWLDAHGGELAKQEDGTETAAPLIEELRAILAHPLVDQHVIMIDDAHVFVRGDKWGAGLWPKLESLRQQWLLEHPDWIWGIEDDVVQIYKRRSHAK